MRSMGKEYNRRPAMKRLDIIVEGPSEREFISQSLAPYLERTGVINAYNVSPIIIHTKPTYRGGMTKYGQLRDDIRKCQSKHCQSYKTIMRLLDKDK